MTLLRNPGTSSGRPVLGISAIRRACGTGRIVIGMYGGAFVCGVALLTGLVSSIYSLSCLVRPVLRCYAEELALPAPWVVPKEWALTSKRQCAHCSFDVLFPSCHRGRTSSSSLARAGRRQNAALAPTLTPHGGLSTAGLRGFWCKPATRPSLGGPGARGGAGERNAPPGLRGARPTVELEGGGVEAPSGLRGTRGGPILNIAPPRQS